MLRLILIAWLALCGAANAQLSGGLQFPGPGTAHSAAAGYTGPLDVIGTNVVSCYSLQACSSALRGSPAVNACDSTGGTDVACADLSTDGTTGLLVAATIGGGTCPGTLGSNCTIKTWYDQTGGTACGGSNCNLKTNAGGVASRPTLIASGYGSGPAAVFTSTKVLETFTTLITLSQPYTFSAVTCRVAAVGGLDIFFGNFSANGSMYWSATPELGLFAGGTAVVAASTNNTWQMYAGAFNDAGGTKSSGMVSGGSLIQNLTSGGGGLSSNAIAFNNTSFPSSFRAVEGLVFSADKSANFSSLQSNQSTRFGSGSC